MSSLLKTIVRNDRGKNEIKMEAFLSPGARIIFYLSINVFYEL